jgi:hypothetical protein
MIDRKKEKPMFILILIGNNNSDGTKIHTIINKINFQMFMQMLLIRFEVFSTQLYTTRDFQIIYTIISVN